MHRLETSSDPLEAAREYVRRYPKHPPDAFRYTSRDRRAAVRKAFGHGSGWAARLVMSCPQITHYTLDTRALGLSPEDADPSRLYDLPTLRRWKAAIRKTFRDRPHRWKVEAGSRIHAHVLADASACPPTLRLGSVRARRCETYLEAVLGYLNKPAAPYRAEHLATYLEARRRLGRLPRLSGVSGIPRSVQNPELNALRVYFASPPSEPTPNEPESGVEIPHVNLESTWEIPKFNRRKPTGEFPQIILISESAAAPREQPVRRRNRTCYPVRHTERRRARAPPVRPLKASQTLHPRLSKGAPP
jgi:hypothetical protein